MTEETVRSDRPGVPTDGDGHVLVGDIGGTRVRFGIVSPDGELLGERDLEGVRHDSLLEAVREYRTGLDPGIRLRWGAIAVACPVLGDRVQMTNRGWSFSVAETRRQLELETLEVINDFSALALALPVLGEEETRSLNEGQPDPEAPLALLGPGTGLGVSALIPMNGRWMALATEGGHRDLAASTEREWRIIQKLQESFGRVSAERVLSGPGLVNLYRAICEIEGVRPEARTPERVVDGARTARCQACVETVRVFSRQLGAVAGDLALTFGSLGGLFIGGGVVPRMGSTFDAGLFGQGFLNKGRFRRYVEPIPVRLITKTGAALRGAARALAGSTPIGIREPTVTAG